MKSIKSTLLFCLLYQIEIMYSQDSCIVAGDSTLAHYTNLIPDVNLVSYGGWLPPDSLDIDLNNDGIFDFTVFEWKVSNWIGDSWGHSRIVAYGQNTILVNSTNQIIPDTLSNTDTICTNGVWKNAGFFFKYLSSFDTSANYYNYEWMNKADRYVGLKLVNSIDSTFGWIQIYAASTTSVLVKNYGCGSITPYVAPLPSVSSDIIIYPNPTYDIVNINLSSYSSYEIKLYNDVGEIVYQNIGNQKLVDLSGLPIGLYVLKIITLDKTFTEKIIKRKKLN